jgi:SpoVK/Ycf46/Vps4 family AAA+-type ATPase
LADSPEIAELYLATVSHWNSEVRGEILVFEDGCWGKSKELFESIQSAGFENLVLAPGLKSELQQDFGKFLESRADFERFGIPWKRGVLFHGLPGNGKTHTLKALINWLKIPCLYVKSFKGDRYSSEHQLISNVFRRARDTTPCLLVLEDLDSLVNDENRSFFLNELDGFAANTGIVIIATTNHPERLDPAILNRPSRFDRKYEFALPDLAERRAYAGLWSERSPEELRLSEEDLEQIAEQTGGFSFAYLKELWLSSMMRWMELQRPGSMGSIMQEQTAVLREQMSDPISEPAPWVDDEE